MSKQLDAVLEAILASTPVERRPPIAEQYGYCLQRLVILGELAMKLPAQPTQTGSKVLDMADVQRHDGSLKCGLPFVDWSPGDSSVDLYGSFSVEDLEAIVGIVRQI